MLSFITDFLSTSLEFEEEVDIKLERAHRALGPKPRAAAAPPRSIIARFLDFNVKQKVLLRAWKQRNIQFQEHTIYFDHDYSPDLQRKRKKVREVIKKLKERNIRAQSPYPAQIRLFLDGGTRLFTSLLEAHSTLKELGIETAMEDREILERELTREGWSIQQNRRKNQQLNPAENRAFVQGEYREARAAGVSNDE
ncbi:hypothetical protein D5F01_LYC01254 [Larimichthys crocea]|uniref:LINE-1 type transposase domain-containing protein 1 n=1 Tax=Larimichthys crocea TaxID=215358 RepID=A0A6G0JBE7_LARCR|nr:hypothetical protein D5F01_LYC01254 [Larimichthys crocea]